MSRKRIAYVLGALLLVVVSVSPAHAAPPGGHLNIAEVFVIFGSPDTVMIMGEDFDFGPGPLVVTLGDFGPLTIVGTPTPTEIVAELPTGLPAGDYLLTVSTGNGQSQNDEFDLTIGAVGPEGPQGSQGPQGPQGIKGDTGLSTIRVVTETHTFSSSLLPVIIKDVTVECAEGGVALASGWELDSASLATFPPAEVHIERARPNVLENPTAWIFEVHQFPRLCETFLFPQSCADITFYVVCAHAQ